MKHLTGSLLLLSFHTFLGFISLGPIVRAQSFAPPNVGAVEIPPWISPKVQHAYGLPEVKANAKGRLAIDSAGIAFISKSSTYAIPRRDLTAMSNGNERVELWGVKGRLLRMAIPNGGDLAAAGVLHHKVNMLTVEFRDVRGSYHAAVFYVPAGEGEHVLSSFSEIQAVKRDVVLEKVSEPPTTDCSLSTSSKGVVVMAPNWDKAEVPAAYRALVYEHVIDRLQRVQGIGHVYRDGEQFSSGSCPQFRIQIAVSAYKAGSQVKRSMMGPVGFFVGTSQISFSASITDTSRRLNVTEELKSTVRGESESKGIADGFAKKLAKTYSKQIKALEASAAAKSTVSVRS